MNQLLCGSKCIKYILDRCNYKNINVNPKMRWISELAIYIKNNTSLEMIVRCYNSNLLNDYYKTNSHEFDGFRFLESMLEAGVVLEEEKFTIEKLIEEIEEYRFIILCVETKKINNDNSMSGGHYVVLEKAKNNIVKVHNPQKKEMAELYFKYSDIIDLCSDFGSWRILIRE